MRFLVVIAVTLVAAAGLALSEWKQKREGEIAQRTQDSLQGALQYEQRQRERRDQQYLDMLLRYGAEYVTRDSLGYGRLRTEEELRAWRREAGIPELRRICGTFNGKYQCTMAQIW